MPAEPWRKDDALQDRLGGAVSHEFDGSDLNAESGVFEEVL